MSLLMAVSFQMPLALVAAPVASAAPTTLEVCASGCTYTTIAAALAAAQAGDTVQVQAGTYPEWGLEITAGIRLLGEGAGTTTIGDAANAGTVLAIHGLSTGTAEVSGFTIRSGPATSIASNGIRAYAISGDASVVISDNVIYGATSPAAATKDQYPILVANGAATSSIAIERNLVNAGADNTIVLEKWLGDVSIVDNVLYRSADPAHTSSVIFAMNYSGSAASGTQLIDGNTFVMGGVPVRSDLITFGSAYDPTNTWTWSATNAGTYDDVRITNNAFTGIDANTRGIILWNGGTATNGALHATVTGNTFAGASGSVAVRLTGLAVSADIRNNDFSGEAVALRAFPYNANPAPDAATVVFADNSVGTAVDWANGTGTLDATDDWWGAATGPTAGQTAGAVLATPWIASYTTSAEPPGFWPTEIVEGFPAGEPVETTSGTGVAQQFFLDGTPGGTITFDTVATGGTTTVTPVTSGDAGYVTPTFAFGTEPVYFEIETTAVFSGPIEICLVYDPANFPGATPSILHYDGSAWQNVTTSIDTTNHIVCGAVTSLSPIALGLSSKTGLGAPTTWAREGESVTFTATLTPADATGSVTFYDGATTLGTTPVLAGSADYATSALTVGIHQITAEYGGDENYPDSSSDTTAFTVLDIPAVGLASDRNPSIEGDVVTFTATVTGTTPTGTVRLFEGPTELLSCSLASGECTAGTAALTPGTHLIRAEYEGDGLNVAATSGDVSQVVKAHTVTTVTSDIPSATYGQHVTYTVTVTDGTGALVTTGSVEVYDNGVLIKTCDLSKGACTYASDPTAGTHVITAEYLGDSATGESDGDPLSQQVAKASLSVDARDGQKTFGQPDPSFAYDLNGFVLGENATSAAVGGTGACVRTNASVQSGGTYPGVIDCTGGTLAAANYQFASGTNGTFTILAATGAITYLGPTYIVGSGGTTTIMLSSDVGVCTTNEISYEFTPVGGGASTTTTNGTVDLATGLYTVHAVLVGNDDCTEAEDFAVLSVVTAGDTANGGGWYRVGLTPPTTRVNFGFNVTKQTSKKVPGLVTYRGQLLWMAKSWRLKGTIYSSSTDATQAAYGLLPSCPAGVGTADSSPKCASFTGTGILQQWNDVDLRWDDVTTATFTATVYDGGSVTTCKRKNCTKSDLADWFGIQINEQPALALPEWAPIMLNRGSIKAS